MKRNIYLSLVPPPDLGRGSGFQNRENAPAYQSRALALVNEGMLAEKEPAMDRCIFLRNSAMGMGRRQSLVSLQPSRSLFHILLSREEGSKPAPAILLKVSLCPASS
jgi:hypothetical protein